MAVFAVAFVFSLLFYLALTAGSGSVGVWALEELVAGVVFAVLAGLLARKLFEIAGVRPGFSALNPLRWVLLVTFAVGPLFFAMAKANLDVAYRVVTGRIRPGIVKISPGLKSDLGKTILANSITLTPGTLSVEYDKKGDLFVHWINVKDKDPKPEQVCGSFCGWARRIAE